MSLLRLCTLFPLLCFCWLYLLYICAIRFFRNDTYTYVLSNVKEYEISSGLLYILVKCVIKLRAENVRILWAFYVIPMYRHTIYPYLEVKQCM
ncbi:unnamed protein product [Arctia plantaginis]|uniref:Uncharacterized protein n=1 Tax=Arctia plantaginis TaxID=874455 RepID=A0A8S0ZFX6_ARCPL|nr:unnamed protein product [Arctia plantaginis]